MIGDLPLLNFGLRMDPRKFFFDKQGRAISHGVQATSHRVLHRCGAFVQRTGRQSMRIRKKASAPGTPPSAHTAEQKAKAGFAARGPLLKTGIIYEIELGRLGPTVVIGPRFLRGSKNNVPETLEFGGQAVVKKFIRTAPKRVRSTPLSPAAKAAFLRGIRDGSIVLPKTGHWERRVIRVAARPYMRPAMMRELPKFPSLWSGQVRPAALTNGRLLTADITTSA